MLRKINVLLMCALIITFSLTYEGIMDLYTNVYSKKSPQSTINIKVDGNDCSFRLPSGWSHEQKHFEGGEVLYHLDFISTDKKINGFSEIWKINKPLSEFLEESKISPAGDASLNDYKLQNTKIGIYNGYVLEYSRRGNDGRYYKAAEYFIPLKGEYFFRISFFVGEDDYNKNIKMVIENIINSIQLRKSP